jgi:BirA family transcriptional regulator, biotin operon repressor / biotin---[acetyl-CoA-carboxylase] ligase
MKTAFIGPRPLTFALLRLLADGKFHSGENMARQLDISRASVHHALREVEDYGLALYRVRGRGYCLADSPQWLDATSITRHLGKQRKQFYLTLLDSAPSSNTLLMQQMTQGAPSGTVLAVEWQTAGRGRMGRIWHSGLGNALTFSLLWRFDRGLAALSGLSLAVGIALIRALRACNVEGAQLKWPNDVLDEHGAKLAGVLIEAQGDMLGPSAVAIGIGLNLTLPQHVSQQIERTASSLTDMNGTAPDRNHLLAVLLLELASMLRDFTAQGFAGLRAEWESLHALQGKRVNLSLPDGSQMAGIAHGVTGEGALKLETNKGMQIFHAGDISLTTKAHHAAA